MAITRLNPYLNLDGTCGLAIALYEKALGAKVEKVQRFGDMPGADVPAEHRDRVIHALLHIGPDVVMLSDTQPGESVPPGGNVHICLDYDEPQEMARHFEALSAGGTVTMPLQDTFWGAKFGTLTDAYGIRWMFNCTLQK